MTYNEIKLEAFEYYVRELERLLAAAKEHDSKTMEKETSETLKVAKVIAENQAVIVEREKSIRLA